jgi:hypothetical protein
MKAIAYSLFGYNKVTPANCFEFETYVRGFFVNMRINRIVYPGWTNVLNMDQSSYDSPYRPIFEWIKNETQTQIVIHSEAPLCKAMLWRFKTVFAYDHPNWKYSHTICRDTDSISTYREAQAVAQWIQEDRTAHCITDSVSHNIEMMGGMCGFRPGYLNDRLRITDEPMSVWDKMIDDSGIDFNRKGSDQDFLMKYIYPKVAKDSVTAHFCLGIRHSVPEENGIHYSIPDIDIGVDQTHKFLNTCAGHIGAAGYYEPPMLKWLKYMDPHAEFYQSIQKQFPKIFFWT